MAQMVSNGRPRSVPAGVVTVADLLNRNAPAPARPRPPAPPRNPPAPPRNSAVSVDSLLRREGLDTQPVPAAAPPARSRAKESGPVKEKSPRARGSVVEAGGRHVVRASAVAVGTLLAAGSVFGTAVVTDTAHSTNDAAANGTQPGSYPGAGRLDAPAAAVAAPQAPVVDQATPGPLDAGIAPPKSWTPVAFPNAAGGASRAATPAAPAAPNTPAADAQIPAPPTDQASDGGRDQQGGAGNADSRYARDSNQGGSNQAGGDQVARDQNSGDQGGSQDQGSQGPDAGTGSGGGLVGGLVKVVGGLLGG
ncbi:hypothetical protein [Pseudonocardia sp. GCM10023141]|uniref:hypothetical protein n=1 Tax=Pseudonocardia sp. GCM10023141 TaxID=3252653 RepID=UPI003621A30F